MPTEYVIRVEDSVSDMPNTSKNQSSVLTDVKNTESANREDSVRNEQSVFGRDTNVCKVRLKLEVGGCEMDEDMVVVIKTLDF